MEREILQDTYCQFGALATLSMSHIRNVMAWGRISLVISHDFVILYVIRRKDLSRATESGLILRFHFLVWIGVATVVSTTRHCYWCLPRFLLALIVQSQHWIQRQNPSVSRLVTHVEFDHSFSSPVVLDSF